MMSSGTIWMFVGMLWTMSMLESIPTTNVCCIVNLCSNRALKELNVTQRQFFRLRQRAITMERNRRQKEYQCALCRIFHIFPFIALNGPALHSIDLKVSQNYIIHSFRTMISS